jgi:hypothetical protein
MSDRDAKKQSLARLRIHLQMRQMSDPETKIFFEDFLAFTENLTVDEFNKVAERILVEPGRKWFPTVGEWKAFEKRFIHREPVPEVAKIAAPIEWSDEDFQKAEAQIEMLPQGSQWKVRLGGMLQHMRGRHDG